jgi:hypothetical protein
LRPGNLALRPGNLALRPGNLAPSPGNLTPRPRKPDAGWWLPLAGHHSRVPSGRRRAGTAAQPGPTEAGLAGAGLAGAGLAEAELLAAAGLTEAGVAAGKADQRLAGFGHVGDP